MSLRISCSARFLKTSSRSFDKVVDEFFPKKYWMRLRFSASGQMHKGCLGKLTGLWGADHQAVSGFDALIMAWTSEPVSVKGPDTSSSSTGHYRVDIPAGGNEKAGLVHIKLYPDAPLAPDQQKEWEEFPEVQLNRSRNESSFRSKRVTLPYGEYFIGVSVTDSEGTHTKAVFRFAAYPEPERCQIRPASRWERLRIALKSYLPSK